MRRGMTEWLPDELRRPAASRRSARPTAEREESEERQRRLEGAVPGGVKRWDALEELQDFTFTLPSNDQDRSLASGAESQSSKKRRTCSLWPCSTVHSPDCHLHTCWGQ